jgi:cobalt-zinc-cadmium efflux system protein
MPSRPAPSGRFTYGFRRATIVSSLGNAVLLLVMTGGIAWEAIQRLTHPRPTCGSTVVLVALAGTLISGATAMLLTANRRDLNIRTMFVHMAVLAAGVAIGGAVMMITQWSSVDPIVSLTGSVVILVTARSLLKEGHKLIVGRSTSRPTYPRSKHICARFRA